MFKLESMDQLVISYYWVYEVSSNRVELLGLYEYDGAILYDGWTEYIDSDMVLNSKYIVVPILPPNIEDLAYG